MLDFSSVGTYVRPSPRADWRGQGACGVGVGLSVAIANFVDREKLEKPSVIRINERISPTPCSYLFSLSGRQKYPNRPLATMLSVRHREQSRKVGHFWGNGERARPKRAGA